MLQMTFRFPAGRYHATPWGHHVNEGMVEWPPSPWRLLRALVATAFSKLGLPDPVPEDHPLRSLVLALAAELPSYSLPAATAAHSRHYMPLAALDKGREKTTLVLDACAIVGTGELVVAWPVEVDPPSRALLRDILAAMGYLGRSESWVTAELTTPAQPPALNSMPDDGSPVPPGEEQYPVLAAVGPARYDAWLAERRTAVLGDRPDASTVSRFTAAQRRAREKAMVPYPSDLFECLLRDTAWQHAHGWSQPPGSRRVIYRRPAEALSGCKPPRTAKRAAQPAVQAVLLALSSDHKQNVLPLLSRVVPQAELLHRALVSRAAEPVFTGRDESGQLLTGHRHLHILPLGLDSPGRIDHLLLWAPMGIGGEARAAIAGLRHVWTKGQEAPLAVSAAGEGTLADLASLIGDLSRPARVWHSRTPFVPPRHLKRSGANALTSQVQAELNSRGFPEATVEVMTREEWAERKLHQFVRTRGKAYRAPPQDCGLGLRLTFDEPITGPVCLGYASHFGLGLFAAGD